MGGVSPGVDRDAGKRILPCGTTGHGAAHTISGAVFIHRLRDEAPVRIGTHRAKTRERRCAQAWTCWPGVCLRAQAGLWNFWVCQVVGAPTERLRLSMACQWALAEPNLWRFSMTRGSLGFRRSGGGS